MSTVLIRGAKVLDPDLPLVERDVAIADGRIIDITQSKRVDSSATVVDATGMVVMPGLVNAHTHSGQSLDRGVAGNLPLDMWMMWVVYGGVHFDIEDRYTLALTGALEMLKAGCTSVLDHSFVAVDGFEDTVEAVLSAYSDAGMRVGLAPMISDKAFFDSMPSLAGIKKPDSVSQPASSRELLDLMERFLQVWTGRSSLVTPMVGPSAPQRCTEDLLLGLGALSNRFAAPVHTHVNETASQVRALREHDGRSATEVLAEAGLLTERTSLAHGVWLDRSDFERIREARATVVHNPVSNLRLGSGLMPLAGMLEGGVSVAIGTDGGASNDSQNMFEAMKFGTLIHTLTGRPESWPTAEQVWGAGLKGGAQAMTAKVGSISVGSKADLVLISLDRHIANDRTRLVQSLVMADQGQSVDSVMVGGEFVVREGQSVRIDEKAFRDASHALRLRIDDQWRTRQSTLDDHSEYLAAIQDDTEGADIGIERRAEITPAF